MGEVLLKSRKYNKPSMLKGKQVVSFWPSLILTGTRGCTPTGFVSSEGHTCEGDVRFARGVYTAGSGVYTAANTARAAWLNVWSSHRRRTAQAQRLRRAGMDKEQIQFENEQIQRCAISGERYEDPQFPASDASLGEPPPQPVQWLRPAAALGPVELFAPAGAVATFELGAARLHDCWLLGALAALATHPALLQRVFVSTRAAAYGMYTLQLYWHDEWVQVTVDDRLPCDAHKAPLYVRSGERAELWPALVEKAC